MAKAALYLISTAADDHVPSMSERAKMIYARRERAKRNAALATALSGFEPDIYDIGEMMALTQGAIEDAIGYSHEKVTGSRDLLHIPHEHANTLMFAVNHLQGMVRAFHVKYFGALDS